MAISELYPFLAETGYRVDKTFRKIDSTEKVVHRLIKEDTYFALKIYKSRNALSGQIQNRDRKSKHEFESYQKLYTGNLRRHVPSPIELAYTQVGRSCGLIVEWKSGVTLYDYRPRRIQRMLIDVLEFDLNESKLPIEPDCLTEYNLCYDEITQALWFAELKLKTDRDYGLWPNQMRRLLHYIKEHYCE